jgi:hypothetical protein
MEWREQLRALDKAGAQLLLSKITAGAADVAPAAHEKRQETRAKECQRMSVTGSQAALLFQVAAQHASVCPRVAVAAGDAAGIPAEQAEWYESAHEDGLKQAQEANDGVSGTAVGNGWEYSDGDVLGMVAPLSLRAHDSVIDVGCGDGYFLERLLRLQPQLQVPPPPPLLIRVSRAAAARHGRRPHALHGQHRPRPFPPPCPRIPRQPRQLQHAP